MSVGRKIKHCKVEIAFKILVKTVVKARAIVGKNQTYFVLFTVCSQSIKNRESSALQASCKLQTANYKMQIEIRTLTWTLCPDYF